MIVFGPFSTTGARSLMIAVPVQWLGNDTMRETDPSWFYIRDRGLRRKSLGQHGLGKFRKMLHFFNVNFKEGALLSFLIIAGEVKFIKKFKRKMMPSFSQCLRQCHVH